MFKSAELRATHLRQSIEGFDAEGKKLAERLAAAQEQYNAGLSKLKATNKQLQSLASSVLIYLSLYHSFHFHVTLNGHD